MYSTEKRLGDEWTTCFSSSSVGRLSKREVVVRDFGLAAAGENDVCACKIPKPVVNVFCRTDTWLKWSGVFFLNSPPPFLTRAIKPSNRGTSRPEARHPYCLISDHTHAQISGKACCWIQSGADGTRVIFPFSVEVRISLWSRSVRKWMVFGFFHFYFFFKSFFKSPKESLYCSLNNGGPRTMVGEKRNEPVHSWKQIMESWEQQRVMFFSFFLFAEQALAFMSAPTGPVHRKVETCAAGLTLAWKEERGEESWCGSVNRPQDTGMNRKPNPCHHWTTPCGGSGVLL